jgi:hypothetical protein
MPENALDGYRKIAEDSVVPLKNQYNWRADWQRRNFRLSVCARRNCPGQKPRSDPSGRPAGSLMRAGLPNCFY